MLCIHDLIQPFTWGGYDCNPQFTEREIDDEVTSLFSPDLLCTIFLPQSTPWGSDLSRLLFLVSMTPWLLVEFGSWKNQKGWNVREETRISAHLPKVLAEDALLHDHSSDHWYHMCAPQIAIYPLLSSSVFRWRPLPDVASAGSSLHFVPLVTLHTPVRCSSIALWIVPIIDCWNLDWHIKVKWVAWGFLN